MSVQYRKLAATRLTVTSTSSTLATLKGSAVLDVKYIMLIPEDSGDDIRMAVGEAATGTTAKLAALGLPIDKALADTIQLYAAANSYVTLIELG